MLFETKDHEACYGESLYIETWTNTLGQTTKQGSYNILIRDLNCIKAAEVHLLLENTDNSTELFKIYIFI